jgi:hypothetical protein
MASVAAEAISRALLVESGDDCRCRVALAQPPAQYQNVMHKRLKKAKKLALVHPAKSFRRSGVNIIALQIKKIAAYKAAPGVVLETEFLAETLTIIHQSPKCTYMSYIDSDHEVR